MSPLYSFCQSISPLFTACEYHSCSIFTLSSVRNKPYYIIVFTCFSQLFPSSIKQSVAGVKSEGKSGLAFLGILVGILLFLVQVESSSLYTPGTKLFFSLRSRRFSFAFLLCSEKKSCPPIIEDAANLSLSTARGKRSEFERSYEISRARHDPLLYLTF
jgi:hypothetical protein